MSRSLAALGLAACAIAACGDAPARVTLAPIAIEGSACGRPSDATQLLVAALGDGAEVVRSFGFGGGPVAIDDFPPGTRQLEVTVLGGGGARALGRTAPLVYDELPDGAVVPVLMAPPEGGCPVGRMTAPRDAPLVIAAGDGALIVGGRDAAGAPLPTAEWYDPATATFTALDVPSALTGDLGAIGMAAATLPDGRVVLTGGARPVVVVFDPRTRAFDPPGALFEIRAHHAAVALDATRVLVAGGCGVLDETGACAPMSERRGTFVVDVVTGEITDGPMLARARVGGAAWLEPPVPGGAASVLLVGGRDGAGVVADAERVPVGGGATAIVPGAGGLAAPLASGSVVAHAPGGEVAVVVPGVDAARPVDLADPDPGSVTALEDGGVLVAYAGGALARYRPGDGRVVALATPATVPAGHGAARLPDGTVLFVGGAGAVDDAWVFRPAGDSPFAGAVTVTPGDGGDVPLVPFDPAAIDDAGGYAIAGADGPAFAVIGGMRPGTFTLDAVVDAAGGLAVLLGFDGPGDHDAVELVAGEPARLVRRVAGAAEVTCRGDQVVLGTGVPVRLEVTADAIAVTLGESRILQCGVDAPRAGAVGIGAIGPGASVALSTVSVTR